MKQTILKYITIYLVYLITIVLIFTYIHQPISTRTKKTSNFKKKQTYLYQDMNQSISNSEQFNLNTLPQRGLDSQTPLINGHNLLTIRTMNHHIRKLQDIGKLKQNKANQTVINNYSIIKKIRQILNEISTEEEMKLNLIKTFQYLINNLINFTKNNSHIHKKITNNMLTKNKVKPNLTKIINKLNIFLTKNTVRAIPLNLNNTQLNIKTNSFFFQFLSLIDNIINFITFGLFNNLINIIKFVLNHCRDAIILTIIIIIIILIIDNHGDDNKVKIYYNIEELQYINV